MSEHKNQPFHKAFLWFILCIAGFGLFFGLLISLTSSASFLEVFGWIMASGAAIAIPTFFWGYVLEPYWWDKLTHETQEKIRNWGIGLFLLAFFVLIPLGMFGGNTWSGKGTVNLFPDGATSKNYRLTADMQVDTGWWWSKRYTIKSVDWPDSGTSYFSNCVISKSSYTCTDNEGRTWHIEVEQAPGSFDDNN